MSSFVSPAIVASVASVASVATSAERVGVLRQVWRGFVLPFSLIAAALRDPGVRRAYLLTNLVRLAITSILATGMILGTRSFVTALDRFDDTHRETPAPAAKPGGSVALRAKLHALGDSMQSEGRAMVDEGGALPSEASASHPLVVRKLALGYAWLLWILAVIASPEVLVVLLSRRWDAWLGVHFSRLADAPREDGRDLLPPRIGFDARWLAKRFVNGLRGSLLFAAGLPFLLPLQLVPQIGDLLFAFATTVWGGYWYVVSTTGKSALAWTEDGKARPPAFVRELQVFSEMRGCPAPLRFYARLWTRLSRRDSSAAAMFERSPAAFLGLALARLVLSLPGLSLFTRPVMPVAASRLCADAVTTASLQDRSARRP